MVVTLTYGDDVEILILTACQTIYDVIIHTFTFGSDKVNYFDTFSNYFFLSRLIPNLQPAWKPVTCKYNPRSRCDLSHPDALLVLSTQHYR